MADLAGGASMSTDMVDTAPLPSVPNAIDDFMHQYMARYNDKNGQNMFKAVAKKVKTIMRDICEKADKQPIKVQCSSRAKKPEDLREKLEILDKRFKFRNAEHIKETDAAWDLAGVRVQVYFPDDAASVLWHLLYNQTQLRLLTDPQARDSARAPQYIDFERRKFPLGLSAVHNFFEGQMVNKDKDGFVRTWKHLGYQAIHFHVAFNEPKEPSHESETPCHGTRDGAIETPDISIESGGPSTQTDNSLWCKRVEVQVMSVVMHAWSEVEHDLIYKNKQALPRDLALDRILDSINGLAMTSETLLQQLQQTLKALADEGSIPLRNANHVEDIMQRYRHSSGEVLKHRPGQQTLPYVEVLWGLLRSEEHGIRNVKQLRDLIESVPKYYETEWSDLAGLLIIELGTRFEVTESLNTLGESRVYRWFYDLLVVANAISIEAGFGETPDWNKPQAKAISLMYQVLIGDLDAQTVYGETDYEEYRLLIEEFCEQYRTSDPTPFTRRIALALARMSFIFILGEPWSPPIDAFQYLQKFSPDSYLPPLDLGYILFVPLRRYRRDLGKFQTIAVDNAGPTALRRLGIQLSASRSFWFSLWTPARRMVTWPDSAFLLRIPCDELHFHIRGVIAGHK